jgi:predicted AlkP superfamily pyrophosphatase or phosphodiesterase
MVVGIVVDQMRWDYLYRYADRWTAGGFKRLLREGFSCEQTFINYIPTYTAPGHACVWTGSIPAIHGIAGNDWIDRATGKAVYCVEDKSVLPVGGSQRAGLMSPRNLLTTTVGDELRLATNGRSRVYSLSLKDRASILPGGHQSNGSYWYDDSTGNLMTSTYYEAQLPQWLQRFNARRLPDSALAAGWELLQPADRYRHSTADNSPSYEGNLKGETAPVFPHTGLKAGSYGTLRYLPAGNTYILQAAKEAIRAEKLGQGTDPDVLAINLAATDYAGHLFGPNALELEDMYLRLDRDLAGFLRFLDAQFGEGNVLFFLTADHGAAHNAQYLRDRRVPSGGYSEVGFYEKMSAFADSLFGNSALAGKPQTSLVRFYDNSYVYLNDTLLAARKLDRTRVQKALRSWILVQEGVSQVVCMEPESTEVLRLPQPIRDRVIAGYHPRRSGDLLVLFEPAWYAGYARTGTTHGTWNPYDSHIPLLWHGWGIEPGKSQHTYHMTDIAATISALLNIQMPNGCVGAPVPELFPIQKSPSPYREGRE